MKFIKLFVHFRFILILLSLSSAHSQNFLINGDFESGGSSNGFLVTSPYNLATTPGTSVPGNYAFVTNPQSLNSTFRSDVDNTTGTGKMMVVDGSTTTGLNFFWTAGSTGGAIPGFVVGQRYIFSYYIKSVSDDVTSSGTQANINFFTAPGDVDPNTIVPSSLSYIAPLPAFGWQKVFYEFTAKDTSVLFRLYNTNIGSLGNDFAIDDMSVVCATPPTLIISNPSPVCSPSTVDLTLPAVSLGSDGNAADLSYWTNPTGTTPLSSPSAVAISGTYYIKLIISGCVTIKPVVVTIQTNTLTPPTVSAIAICQSKTPVALTATATLGSTLIWYGTNGTLGTPSLTAPIPSTATLGVTNYYVSQTNGVCESARKQIPVNVAVDTGATILNFRCDSSQILPADKNSSVYFDWSNNPSLSNTYNYSYTILGGSPVTGTTGVSHLQVPGMTPGQSATLILTSASHPCTTATLMCSVPCPLPLLKPDFAPITQKYCLGDNNMPTLLDESPNKIKGTWSPSIISNAKSDTYRFTPDPILFPCAETQDLFVTVIPVFTPTFDSLPSFVCENAIAPVLPIKSTNTPPIIGTWDSVINTSILGPKTYTFIPDVGQCVSSIATKVNIEVRTSQMPNFANISPICSGSTAIPTLLDTAPNGIMGKWIPDKIDNKNTAIYTFTPTSSCSSSQILNVIVNQNITPTFAVSDTQCEGAGILTLSNSSTNTPSIIGTWDDNTIDTSILGSNTYNFTAAIGSCVILPTTPKTITVYATAMPTFNSIPDFCSGTLAPSFPIVSGGISGKWFPDKISNVAGSNQKYQFTPDTALFPCVPIPPLLSVTVIPSVIPTFLPSVPTDVCENAALPNLPTASNDSPPITGVWSTLKVDPIATIDTSIVGTELYTFIPDSGQCVIAPSPIAITVNSSNTLTAVSYTASGAFTDNQIIEVTALSTGDYLYQLDSGPLQTSPVFEYVSSGMHTITVSDANGCSASITKNDIIVMNYPKFFTPNGDGFNDTWKITDLSSLISKIYIFDRYGKLLKEISPDGLGWDGTYLGEQMPADDYWFTVDYIENLISKKLKSHFTLKR